MELALKRSAIDLIMPMHLALGRDGMIESAGTTLRRIWAAEPLDGLRFFEVFSVLRPAAIGSVADLVHGKGTPLRLASVPPDGKRLHFKALAAKKDDDGGVLLNLGFGMAVMDAIQRFDLTQSDFAATDLTMELLFLSEAKSVAMAEWQKLASRLVEARSQAETEAHTDALTGLGNRRAFDEQLQDLTRQRRAFCLVLMDLDHFKDINDRHGHPAGDHALKEFARTLQSCARSEDWIGRIGGDEFALILPDRSGPLAINTVTQRLLERLFQPARHNGAALNIGASMGGTSTDLYTSPTPQRMIEDADRALFASKSAGRSCVSVITSEGVVTMDRAAEDAS